jgi:flagellar biosynthetic protein FlhB
VGYHKIKHRQRQVQMKLATQRLRRDVPTADVVVTNPTHVAVAIKYDAETMEAPKVVAKGADEIALRIRQIAAEFSIPMIERPPLARALFEAVEVGEYVPERLYKAIAEVLAYVYELTGRSPVGKRQPLMGVPG